MPWDPKPTVESEANAAASKQAAAAQVKEEEVDPANGITYNPPEMASARAAALLQQTFGNQANASADALRQRGIALPGGQTMAAPSAPAPAPTPAPAANNGANPQAQVKQENLSLSQTDGGGDVPETWDEVMAARRCADPESVAEHDATLRLAGTFDMNNGLMLPLGQSKRDGKKPKPIGPSESNTGQHDGAADNDDEDAINSDLDDPDDDAEGGDADDDDIQSMLCTYDKVHRTKNRWKCYLKDGILLANGKE